MTGIDHAALVKVSRVREGDEHGTCAYRSFQVGAERSEAQRLTDELVGFVSAREGTRFSLHG